MSKINFKYFLIDENSKPPVKNKPNDSGFDVFVHSFKKAWVRSGYREELVEADERGIIPTISLPLSGDSSGTPKEIRENLKPNAVILNPGDRLLMGVGFMGYVEGDPGKVYELQVRPRSGNSTKQGLVVSNTPGTIDCSYRGEICVCITNTSGNTQRLTIGDKIAQLVPSEVPQPELVEVTSLDELGDTSRGAEGFGSSGN